ncbi:MAG: hypothetical protein M3O35_16945 [Acidobacteriota bacterium]|nr:hypothetical protein [Acidobacteriota bacterium]
MTSAEFRDLVRRQTDEELLGPCLHDDQPPYVFQPREDRWDAFRDELASGLGVLRADIRVVGSGRFGFSLKPGYNLKSFADTSDIDVVVINTGLFDQLWGALLEAAYPRPPITNHLGGWLGKRRNEVYTGWLTPLEIKLDPKIVGVRAKPVVDFNFQWFKTLKEASRHPLRRHEDITSRLYRTWFHAELYHLNSLAALRRSLAD